MKRILSCIIALSVFLGLMPVTIAEETAAIEYDMAEEFAIGMGYVTEYDRDKVITRAEFAGVLARMFGLVDEDADKNEWQDSNYGEEKTETVIIEDTRVFSDVDTSHPYYREIMAVYNKGHMRGVGSSLFAPEYNLAMKDAVSVFINMLGYAQRYRDNGNVPEMIGLLDNLNVTMDRPATQKDIVGLIYNSLDIKVIKVDLFGDHVGFYESDDSFMTELLKLKKVSGVMTDNGKTTFTGDSKIAKNELKVGNMTAEYTDDIRYAVEFIGHRVEMFYGYEDGENVAKFVRKAPNDDSVTFDIKDFAGFANNTISYYEGTRKSNCRLDTELYMIYNGAAKTVFDAATFDFQMGEVTLISADSASYNVIIVKSYEFAVVNTRNTNNKTILNKIRVDAATDRKAAELNLINCTEGEDYEEVTIMDTEGNEMTFDALAENDVLNILRNSRELTITVNKNKVEQFNVRATGKDDSGRTVIENGENALTIADIYDISDAAIDFRIGNIYDIYLTMFGTVIWAEKAQEGESIGVLTKVFYYDEFELARFVTIYTTDGKLVQFDATEKIKLNGNQVKFENVWAELQSFYGKPILYETNEAGELVKIITPEGFGEFGDRGWHEIAPEGDYQYHTNANDLGRMMYYVSGKTTIFTVPTDATQYDDEKKFSVNSKSFTDNGDEKAAGYARDKYSVIPDVMIIKTDEGTGKAVGGDSILLIENVFEGVNQYNESVIMFSGYNIKDKSIQRGELSVSAECLMVHQNGVPITGDATEMAKPATEVGPRTPAELQAGDVIRYRADGTGEVTAIRIAYDMSTGKSFSTGAGDPDNANGTTVAGYAYVRSGEGVRITRGTNTSPTDVNMKQTDMTKPDSVANTLYAFRVNCPNAILVVEQSGRNGKPKVYQGSLDDLQTYQNTSTVADTDILVLLAHWSSAIRGAVIYK